MNTRIVATYINKLTLEIKSTRDCNSVEKIMDNLFLLRMVHKTVSDFERNLILELDDD